MELALPVCLQCHDSAARARQGFRAHPAPSAVSWGCQKSPTAFLRRNYWEILLIGHVSVLEGVGIQHSPAQA